MTLDPVDRLRRLLALTLYDVRQHSTPEHEAEVARLRSTFLDLSVALHAGRMSPQQAAPLLEALEHDLVDCRLRVNPTLLHPFDLR